MCSALFHSPIPISRFYFYESDPLSARRHDINALAHVRHFRPHTKAFTL
jgi:hypothetical protein